MQIILIASITRTKNYIIINTSRTIKRAILGCYFLFLDEKKVTKEKSRQNNASTRFPTARPLFCRASAHTTH
jgi:hypothetical protein